MIGLSQAELEEGLPEPKTGPMDLPEQTNHKLCVIFLAPRLQLASSYQLVMQDKPSSTFLVGQRCGFYVNTIELE